jgi:hypothetical protein
MRARLALCLLLTAAAAAAEIIDRIAVSVGTQVITTSDLEREIRVTAFLAGAKPDFSPSARRTTAGRMVEQRLVRRELELSRYQSPDAAEAERALAAFKQTHYPVPAAYEKALAEYGLTDADVRTEILWALTLDRFIDVRFRPGVQIPDEEIAAYFEKQVRPTQPAAQLDDLRDQIEQLLVRQRADQGLDIWLQEAKSRVAIEYRDEVFGAEVVKPEVAKPEVVKE